MSDERRVRVKKTVSKINIKNVGKLMKKHDRTLLPVRVGHWVPPLRMCLSTVYFNYLENIYPLRCPSLQLMLMYRQNTVG